MLSCGAIDILMVVQHLFCGASLAIFVLFAFYRVEVSYHLRLKKSEMGPKRKQQVEEESDKLTRIAIVSTDKCKPKRCKQECKKSCPVVRMGKLCIEVAPNDK